MHAKSWHRRMKGLTRRIRPSSTTSNVTMTSVLKFICVVVLLVVYSVDASCGGQSEFKGGCFDVTKHPNCASGYFHTDVCDKKGPDVLASFLTVMLT